MPSPRSAGHPSNAFRLDREFATEPKKIIADQVGTSVEELTEGPRFVENLGADSLDTVELVMVLEEEFDMDIPEDAATNIQTVGVVIDYAKSHT